MRGLYTDNLTSTGVFLTAYYTFPGIKGIMAYFNYQSLKGRMWGLYIDNATSTGVSLKACYTFSGIKGIMVYYGLSKSQGLGSQDVMKNLC